MYCGDSCNVVVYRICSLVIRNVYGGKIPQIEKRKSFYSYSSCNYYLQIGDPEFGHYFLRTNMEDEVILQPAEPGPALAALENNSVKLAPFWPANVGAKFTPLEGVFEHRGITSQ
jgi:hypothetical protein